MFSRSEKLAWVGLLCGFIFVGTAIFFLSDFWFKFIFYIGLGVGSGSGVVLRWIGMVRLKEKSKMTSPFD